MCKYQHNFISYKKYFLQKLQINAGQSRDTGNIQPHKIQDKEKIQHNKEN